MSHLVRRRIVPPTPLPEFQRPSLIKSKGTSDIAVKSDPEIYTTRLWLREYFVGGIDVVYFIILFQRL
jgi:hypothetical protein